METDSNHINKEMQTYIHLSKYSRWQEDKKARETWDETVDRTKNFWSKRYPMMVEEIEEVTNSIRNLEVMPSMRSLMTAGPALDRDEVAAFNCAGAAIKDPRYFDELFYLLMCGCGVGFSVERQYVNMLPEVAEEIYDSPTVIKVEDSKIGWAKGLKELIALLYNGDCPTWDLSSIRPAGQRLKTFGGRASGPEPLDRLYKYVVRLFKGAKGRKLRSIECHDLMCKIADTVIVGSVRRAACLSMSNLTDDRMRRAKMGDWWNTFPHRALANNSTAYTEKPDVAAFTKELRSLFQSKAGERGIINKEALRKKAEGCDREYSGEYLLNPCGEAILRDSGGLCNLSEVIVRPEDTLEDLEKKVRHATILGTLQSTLTNFRYLRKVWKDNQEEERLLGVSLTGIMDHPVLSGLEIPEMNDISFKNMHLIDVLEHLKQIVKETNDEWSSKLGIPSSKQLTLVKPSGTVSQLCSTSSGIHPRYAKHYIRRVTQDVKDPLTDLMISQGIPYVKTPGEKVLFEFPIKSPEGAILQKDIHSIQQLELWKIYREHWCDGNPSQTIYYTEDSFLDVQAWLYKNWDILGGLSFFPVDDHVYENAPYEEITEEEYQKRLDAFPSYIAWETLKDIEKEDGTSTIQEFACAGGKCEF